METGGPSPSGTDQACGALGMRAARTRAAVGCSPASVMVAEGLPSSMLIRVTGHSRASPQQGVGKRRHRGARRGGMDVGSRGETVAKRPLTSGRCPPPARRSGMGRRKCHGFAGWRPDPSVMPGDVGTTLTALPLHGTTQTTPRPAIGSALASLRISLAESVPGCLECPLPSSWPLAYLVGYHTSSIPASEKASRNPLSLAHPWC